MIKATLPESTSVTIVDGSDHSLESTALAASEIARKAGLCVTAFYKTDFVSTNYSRIVDHVLEQAEKGSIISFLSLRNVNS